MSKRALSLGEEQEGEEWHYKLIQGNFQSIGQVHETPTGPPLIAASPSHPDPYDKVEGKVSDGHQSKLSMKDDSSLEEEEEEAEATKAEAAPQIAVNSISLPASNHRQTRSMIKLDSQVLTQEPIKCRRKLKVQAINDSSSEHSR